ncbi:MAG: molybdopterin-dependent oxidoreductase, partial [Coriobacteriales bacterium]|nr:molybdopterin-dependent oxidoreductase [Coriobacteriales bacterium]
YDPDRVKYPMRRVAGTERGAGQWERISWDEALDELGGKMKAAYEQYGGSAIAFWHSYACTGSMNGDGALSPSVSYGRFMTRTGATVLGPGADWAQMWFVYANSAFYGDDLKDTQFARTVINWGGNPTDAYPQDWNGVCQAKENGARIITIDPQFNAAAAHSDMYVSIIPGTDGALVLAMANYIIENNLVDRDYMMNKSVGPFLLKEDGMYLRSTDIVVPVEDEAAEGEAAEGAEAAASAPVDETPVIMVWDPEANAPGKSTEVVNPPYEGTFEYNGMKLRTTFDFVKEKIAAYTLENASKETGVPVETIKELATIYATEKPVYVHTNQGLGHHVNSHHIYKGLVLLASLTGNFGVHGATPLGHAAVGFGSYPIDSSQTVGGDKHGPSICGMYLPDIVQSNSWAGAPLNIRVLWIENGNPLCCESGRIELIEAVKKIDYVVTCDCNLTDSAMYSDLVLPIPHVYETNDVAGSCFTPYIAFEHKLLDPAYECKTDLEILRGIADRMGLTDLYTKTEE